jgi:TRAP transporter 4TM/12TM fusion protein
LVTNSDDTASRDDGDDGFAEAAPGTLPDGSEFDSSEKYRALPPPLRLLKQLLFVLLTLIGAAWALELQYYLPIPIFKEQYLSLIVTLALPTVFICVKAHPRERAGRVPWYDWCAVLLGAAVGLYVMINYRDLVYDLGSLVAERYILGTIAILLVLEATRRTTGWTLIILAAVFIGYAKFSFLFPGLLEVASPSWQRIAIYLYLDSNGMLGLPLSVTATIIIAFILFGRMLYAVNGDKVFTDLALATMGRRRGGPAKVAVIASSLFGTVSGSAVSNVVMDGPITIPMMKRSGYPGHLAAAIEAVASTGGQIMPPVMGITAFLIAEFLAVSYTEVILAAVIPAVLYYLALFVQVDLEAAKRGFVGIPAKDLPQLREVLRRGWVFAIPIAILLWTLIIDHWQPARAAMAAVIATLLVGFLQKSTRPTLQRLVGALEETGRNIVDLAIITLVAGLVIGALQISGLSFNFSLMLLSFAGGSLLALLLVTALACIVLGMGMPTGVIYVMLAVLVSPALVEMNVLPMAAHLFLFYFGLMSMVTPPVCLATFAAASIAECDFWKAGWAGVRLAIVAYVVPFVMVYQPELIFSGSPLDIALVTLKSVLGVVVISLGLVGFLFAPLGLPLRLVFTLFGFAIMLVPIGISYGPPILAAALLVVVILGARQRRVAVGLSKAA